MAGRQGFGEGSDGAGEGNRTPVSSLGSLRSAIEPHPPERPGGRSRAHSNKAPRAPRKPARGAGLPAPASVAGPMSGPSQQPAAPAHEPGIEPSPTFWPNLLTRLAS